jgi:hypothetical protein
MKYPKQSIVRSIGAKLFLLGLIFFAVGCNSSSPEAEVVEPEVPAFENIIWNVKAIHPDGQTLDIKAFDAAGNTIDIKAVQNSDQDSFLDVKAFLDGEELPVKLLVSQDRFAPVAAIDKTGATYDLKAVTAEGKLLDVKGVSRIGYVVIMKAINEKGDFYGVKAISPTGKLNDIKGIKINAQEREMSLSGVSVHAHVKAMHQAPDEEKFKVAPRKKVKYTFDFERIIWNVKAVTPDGKNLAVKAFDAEGNVFDVKATQDSEQHSFMSIKAFVDGAELPVKVLDSEGEYAPVKAIGQDGTHYDIKALTEEGLKLDVKGVGRSGSLVHVKAINELGEFYGIKAFAPDGKLNDVKGIKIFDRQVEQVSRGNSIQAHLKAINQ